MTSRPQRRRLLLLLLVTLLALTGAGAARATATSGAAAAGPTVGRYSVYEITLAHPSAGLANPWEDVAVEVAFTTPTRTIRVGGFYYGPHTWKARIAPDEAGAWRWAATIRDGATTQRAQGSFTVVDRGAPGFVRPDPRSAGRFVTSRGKAYFPIGYEHSLSDDTGNGTPFDEIGFDGQDVSLCSTDPRCITVRGHDGSIRWQGWVTDLGALAAAFGKSGAGFNLYRWSVDNASFNLFRTLDPAGNVYLEREGQWGDQLVRVLRANGIRVFLTMLGFTAPFVDNPAGMEAVKRYARYVVDRYGAYVDFWELMNEVNDVPDAYVTALADAVRARDPYRHPIATSWGRPQLAAIDIDTPHWYADESEFDSDTAVAGMAAHAKAAGKPVIFGEQGNSFGNWNARSGVRYRLRSWSSLFAGAGLVSWDLSLAQDPKLALGALYIGPEERRYVGVLSRFARAVGPGAAAALAPVSAGLRGYGLAAGSRSWIYVVNATDHANPTVGSTLTVSSPVPATVTFLSPATGARLGTVSVGAGRTTVPLPSFVTDLAVSVAP